MCICKNQRQKQGDDGEADLLAKVSKLEEVVPSLFHPVGPPVPEAVRLAQQDVLPTPCSCPLPR